MNPKGRTFGVVEATGVPASPHHARKGGVAGANLTLKEAKFGCMQKQTRANKNGFAGSIWVAAGPGLTSASAHIFICPP